MVKGGESGKITAINDLPMSSLRSTVSLVFDGSSSKENKIDSLISQMNSFNCDMEKVATVYINFKHCEVGLFVGRFLVDRFSYGKKCEDHVIAQYDHDREKGEVTVTIEGKMIKTY